MEKKVRVGNGRLRKTYAKGRNISFPTRQGKLLGSLVVTLPSWSSILDTLVPET